MSERVVKSRGLKVVSEKYDSIWKVSMGHSKDYQTCRQDKTG